MLNSLFWEDYSVFWEDRWVRVLLGNRLKRLNLKAFHGTACTNASFESIEFCWESEFC